MPRALWIADACRAAGLKVLEVDGWRTRGSESFNPGGVICFPEGTLVLTKRGQVDISEITTEDWVWTHRSRWRKVTGTGSRRASTIILKGQGHPGLETTEEHPFLSFELDSNKRLMGDDGKKHRIKQAVDQQWTPAKDMHGRMWASPINFDDVDEQLEVPEVYRTSKNEKPVDLSPELMWVVGRCLGDGSSSYDERRGHTDIYCNGTKGQEVEVSERVRSAGFSCSIQKKGQPSTVVDISSRPFARWFEENFGKYAWGKKIPAWLLTAPTKYKEAVFEGYLGSDGYQSFADGRVPRLEFLTVSKSLAVGVKLLAQSMGYTACLYFQDRPTTKVWPDGRVSNQRGTWMIRVTKTDNPQDRCMKHKDWLLGKVTAIAPVAEERTVYNFSVEEDESYVIDGIVVHNCHHTAGAKTGDMPSLRVLINGREGLPGPLCNVGLSRSGIVYIVSAGRANHAGTGGWKGLVGNSSVLGIEAENTGTSADPWPQVQLDAYVKLARVLINGTTAKNADLVCAHREWTSRKIDPHSINMSDFRNKVRNLGTAPVPAPPVSGDDEVNRMVLRKPGDATNYLVFCDTVTGHAIGNKFAILSGATSEALITAEMKRRGVARNQVEQEWPGSRLDKVTRSYDLP